MRKFWSLSLLVSALFTSGLQAQNCPDLSAKFTTQVDIYSDTIHHYRFVEDCKRYIEEGRVGPEERTYRSVHEINNTWICLKKNGAQCVSKERYSWSEDGKVLIAETKTSVKESARYRGMSGDEYIKIERFRKKNKVMTSETLTFLGTRTWDAREVDDRD